jgi:hypothetical protein
MSDAIRFEVDADGIGLLTLNPVASSKGAR